MNIRPILAVAGLALICCLSACQLSDVSQAVSIIGSHAEDLSRSAEDFTPEQEHYIGRAVAAQILTRYPGLKNDAANAYLNQLGQALALYSSRPRTFGGYHFLLLDSGEVNAFAAPGGLIFVTRGMVGMVSSESELAAVLAHEIAHVQHNDAIAAIKQARQSGALVGLGSDTASAVGGRYAPAVPGSGLLSLFTGCVNEAVTTMMVKGYSRSQEYAADAAARDILGRTGYDPQALDAVLRVMAQKVGEGSAGFGTTHPTAMQRLDALHGSSSAGVAPEPEARANRFKAAMGPYSLAASR